MREIESLKDIMPKHLLAALFFAACAINLVSLLNTTSRTNSMVQQIYESVSSSKPRKNFRILLVGLVLSLDDINPDVTKSLQQLCPVYNEVEIHIVYAEPSNVVNPYQMKLEKAGCRVTLVDQESLLLHSQHSGHDEFEAKSRLEKLALLRSLQRLEIKQWQQYRTDGVVVNLDLDITTFSPLSSVMHAIHRVNENQHTIACANGYETWHTPWGKMRLYYDTLAAIDGNGEWWYRKYAANIWQIVSFGQARLFGRLLQQSPATFQMQSCFGGLAVYHYTTWSTQECDYTGPSKTDGWKLSSSYTLSGGNSCEHVVFQQCLAHVLPDLQIGIQPNLLIGRDAAIFSTREAYVGVGKAVMALMLLAYCLRQASRLRRPLGMEATWCQRKVNRGE